MTYECAGRHIRDAPDLWAKWQITQRLDAGANKKIGCGARRHRMLS